MGIVLGQRGFLASSHWKIEKLMSLDLEQLEEKLAEKEELVTALTSQLEQAAEQLDRFRRTGADRGRFEEGKSDQSGSANAQSVLSKIDLFVDDWNELEAPSAFSRIEGQLQQIQELLNNKTSIVPQIEEAPEPAEESQQGQDAWSALKNSLLSGEDASGFDPSAYQSDSELDESQEKIPAENNAENNIAVQHAPIEEIDLDLPDAPEPIDSITADKEELLFAIDCRDDYVVILIQQLRELHRKVMNKVPANWEALADDPEAFRNQLEYLEAQLNEQLRYAEVENSVQRAKMARKETRLEQLEKRVNEKLIKAGMDAEVLESIEELPDLTKAPVEKDEPTEQEAKANQLLNFLRSND